MTNLYPGLARGPIDHNASSVINVIANESLDMGAPVKLVVTPDDGEILPRVTQTVAVTDATYGIVVGGDTDGIYGDGTDSSDDTTRASSATGDGVVVVTQGRCLAKVIGTNVVVGSALAASATDGILELAVDNDTMVIARALQDGSTTTDIIAVDVQREGYLETT